MVGGRGSAAAVVHDFLYTDGLRLKMIENREEADDVFLEALLDSGVSGFFAAAMWWGVKTFGESRFNDAGRFL